MMYIKRNKQLKGNTRKSNFCRCALLTIDLRVYLQYMNVKLHKKRTKNLYTAAGFTQFITRNTSYLSERSHVTMRTQIKCYARLTFLAVFKKSICRH
jgi:hypothetical protein